MMITAAGTRECQAAGPQTAKLRDPLCDSRERGIIRSPREDERIDRCERSSPIPECTDRSGMTVQCDEDIIERH